MKRREYIIETDKINQNANIAICSDIHIDKNTSKNKMDKILDTVDKIKPTHIAIPGDLYNMDKKIQTVDIRKCDIYNKTAYLIDGLADIAKTYYIQGNTDTNIAWPIYNWHKNVYPIITYKFSEDGTPSIEMKKINKYNKNGITITGYEFDEDFYKLNEKQKTKQLLEKYKNILESISKNCHKDNYNIFLCHDPIIANILLENKDFNFDLTITAHSHGGLFPIWLKPLIKHMNIDLDLAYPEHKSGIIDINYSKKLIISNGITKYYTNYGCLEYVKKPHIGTIENIKILKK